MLERYPYPFAAPAPRSTREAKKRLARDHRAAGGARHAFSQNVLADEQSFALSLHDEAELAGLPDFMREAMRAEAQERGLDGSTSSRCRVRASSRSCNSRTRRDLREKAFRAFVSRGDNGGKTDNKAIIAEMVRLRAERARLLGYADFAHYRLDDAMAKTPSAVREPARHGLDAARGRALEADRDALQALVQEEGGNFALAPWDWRYYAEKLRQERCDLDEAEIKPYLQLDRMIEAAFDTAERLFGLRFSERTDVPV